MILSDHLGATILTALDDRAALGTEFLVPGRLAQHDVTLELFDVGAGDVGRLALAEKRPDVRVNAAPIADDGAHLLRHALAPEHESGFGGFKVVVAELRQRDCGALLLARVRRILAIEDLGKFHLSAIARLLGGERAEGSGRDPSIHPLA